MTPRDRRALKVGGWVLLLGVLLFRLLPSGWRAWSAAREELAARRALVAHAEVLLGGLDSLEARGRVAREALVALAPRLIAGTSEAAAQADLTGRIALIANRERTRLVRTEAIADSTREARLRRVRLRMEVETDWSGLVGFLRGVAADPAVIRVLSIGVRGTDATGPGTGAEVLSAEIEVSGWYLEGRGSALAVAAR